MVPTEKLTEPAEDRIDNQARAGNSFVSRYKTLGFQLYDGHFLWRCIAHSFGLNAAVAIKTDASVASFILWPVSLLLFGTSTWCIRRALSSRQEISAFFEELNDIGAQGRTIRELRRRAQSLRFNAQLSLVLIVAALASGLALFVYAPNIATYDRIQAMRFQEEMYAIRQKDLQDSGQASGNAVDAVAAFRKARTRR